MDTIFTSRAGVTVQRGETQLDYEKGLDDLIRRLDGARGAYFSSGVEDPDRYSRWDFGFENPPLVLTARRDSVEVRALNDRGIRLLAILGPILAEGPETVVRHRDERTLALDVQVTGDVFPEEERSHQPSVFTPLRRLIEDFAGFGDPFLGLYGAFGYDLIFQFERMELSLPRPEGENDLQLYLPDRLHLIDRRKEIARLVDFEFARDGISTEGAERTPFEPARPPARPRASPPGAIGSDHLPEDYMDKVEIARRHMHAGDIFEVVFSEKFQAGYDGPPSDLYYLMRRNNPSPYEFFIQLGEEQLVGASPEMFVRVEGDRVESSPISGTARRGENAMEDAERILALYNSEKDEVELTMCTDVDRNDKSRICRPGTIKLLSRRMIERYAGLFHTVDHVEGRLRAGFGGLDAFLSHMWAVTLTGAPKPMAARLIERHEASSRGWYGGAIGGLLLSGDVNTGITIRTVHLKAGKADYRAGATLVYDSIPREEELECRLKATAFFSAVRRLSGDNEAPARDERPRAFTGRRVVMIDNEDSFVHTLADYFRQTGAEVSTYRAGVALETLLARKPDLVVHSPGPGRPADFGVPARVRELAEAGVPQFGVCLGLQGIVEAFGGRLDVLSEPRHGKIWRISHEGDELFEGVPSPSRFGAYHSLVAVAGEIPGALEVVARNETGLAMAVRHRELPIAAVQFHPESILSMEADVGHKIVENAMRLLTENRPAA